MLYLLIYLLTYFFNNKLSYSFNLFNEKFSLNDIRNNKFCKLYRNKDKMNILENNKFSFLNKDYMFFKCNNELKMMNSFINSYNDIFPYFIFKK